MQIMQRAWKVGSTQTVIRRKSGNYLSIVPYENPITIIFFDDNYIGYVNGHIDTHQFIPMDLKIIQKDKIYLEIEDARAEAQREMEKFLKYEDGRDYWSTIKD